MYLQTASLLARPLSHTLAKMSELAPLIVVAGSTGVGKSRLSVELAISVRDKLLRMDTSWASSKIINADAMQTYKGLDLVTNKITKAEMNGIEHTLFDFRDLKDDYVVTEWVTDAMAEVSMR
jgi:tRNA dimethylallyltransferase